MNIAIRMEIAVASFFLQWISSNRIWIGFVLIGIPELNGIEITYFPETTKTQCGTRIEKKNAPKNNNNNNSILIRMHSNV